MHYTLFAVVAVLIVCATPDPDAQPAAQEIGVGGSAFHKNDITYSTEVVTPHVSWATKLPDGPIRGFFIPSVEHGRDIVELMQRLDLAPTTVSIDRNWDVSCWGIGDYYGHAERGDRDDFQVVYGYVERDLTGPADFEVMVLPGLHGWSRLTRASRDAILRRVDEGAGLVLIHPFVGDVKQRPFKGDDPEPDPRLWEISPLVDCLDDSFDDGGYPSRNPEALAEGKWELARSHFITEGLALDLLPEGVVGGQFYKYREHGDVLVKSGDRPVIAAKQYGAGRVVALAYPDEGFIPPATDPISTRIYWDYWEQQYSLLARCVVWAAGRDSDIAVARLATGPGDEALAIELHAGTARAAAVEVSVKSEFGYVLGSYRTTVSLTPGATTISVPSASVRPTAGWPGGRRIFEVIVRDARTGATLNWGTASCAEEKPATITTVECSAPVCRRGETLRGVVTSAGDLQGLSVRCQVSDEMGRLLSSESMPAAPHVEFAYPLKDFLGGNALASAELVDGVRVVDQCRAEPVLVVQDQRRQKEYLPIVAFGGGRPYFRNLRRQLVRATGADTGFVWGATVDNDLDMPRGSFGVYYYDRGPTTPEEMEAAIAEFQRTGDFDALRYNTKVELYRRTGGKRFLVRTPCFDDPAVLARLGDLARESAAAKRVYNFDYYFVGDEGSLTSYRDAVDFCWGPHTLAGFREWLKAEYGSLDALNRHWKTEFEDWSSVVPYTTKEAAESGNFPPWADHRTYMEVTFARAYQTVRDGVVAADPDGHIAVSGTQVTSPYNGCDW